MPPRSLLLLSEDVLNGSWDTSFPTLNFSPSGPDVAKLSYYVSRVISSKLVALDLRSDLTVKDGNMNYFSVFSLKKI